jgi:hypothetical protein
MKIPLLLGALFLLCTGNPRQVLAQSTKQTIQQTGNCSVVNAGNGTVNLKCTDVDAALADQIRTIVKSAKRNESAQKDIKEKLDIIIAAQMSGVSFGNLRDRCFEVAGEMGRALQVRDLMHPKSQATAQPILEWEKGNDRYYRWCCERDVIKLHDELVELHIRDLELDQILDRDKDNKRYRDLTPNSPFYQAGCLTIVDIERIAERFQVLGNRMPEK